MPLGELAALGTSVCWSFTSMFFTLAGRRVGSVVVNRIRLTLAVLLLVTAHLLLRQPLPLHVEPQRWLWLGLSGIVGLALGDAFLFQAFLWVGPRLTMLMMSLAPVLSTLLAWLFLDEQLAGRELLAVGVTVAGVAWVVADRAGNAAPAEAEQHLGRGVVFGLLAATGQALGLILAKQGLTVGAKDFSPLLSPLSGTLIRMIVAWAVIWAVTLVTRQTGATLRRLRERPDAWRFLLGGAFFGPFLGVTLSLVAVQATAVGIASTLMALPPIFLLPISRFVFGERIGWQAVAGTFVAIGGVALLVAFP